MLIVEHMLNNQERRLLSPSSLTASNCLSLFTFDDRSQTRNSGDNPSVKEALNWILLVPSGSKDKRTAANDPQSLLRCHCIVCDAPGLIRMNTHLHFCNKDGAGELGKGSSLVGFGDI
jgi:hypothetical protein